MKRVGDLTDQRFGNLVVKKLCGKDIQNGFSYLVLDCRHSALSSINDKLSEFFKIC